MNTYVRRKNRDKRVIETPHFIPHNSHKEPRSSSFSKPHIDFGSASVEEKLPTLSKSSPHVNKDVEEDILHLPLAQWTRFRNKSKAVSTETPNLEVGSLAKLVPVQSQNKSNVDAQRTGTSSLVFVPQKSTISMNSDVCLNPERVVWAKRAPQMWWPAEIMIRELVPVNSGTEVSGEPVLVQYYGSEESGWVDPARDLSSFEDCFEERSRNPSEEFQEALKQAIQKRKQLSLTKQLIASSEGQACYDSGNSTSSSRTESECLKKGSSKRQKLKVHFDEVEDPPAPAKNSRRIRLM